MTRPDPQELETTSRYGHAFLLMLALACLLGFALLEILAPEVSP